MQNQNNTNIKLQKIRQEEEEEKAKELASKLDLSYLNLDVTPIDPSSFKLLKLEEAKNAKAIIIKKLDKVIKIAVKDPRIEQTKKLLNSLEKQGFKLEIFISSESSLKDAWQRFKPTKELKRIVKEIEITPEKIGELKKEISTFDDIKNKLENAPKMTVTEVLEIILAGALKTEASDIHFESEENTARLRLRVDGILQEITDLPVSVYNSILSRIKILSELKINVHDVPQDGRFSVDINNQEVEIRTSIIPGAHGENIVLRILNPDTISLELEDLGLENYSLEIINKELKKPNGMVVNTGPTGSGKTTTLYAFVKKINNPGIKIITLENPIEYHIEGIEQTQINPKEGYTFAVGLKSVLRQDPDIILLGEIRDDETAKTAIHSALTGHLVFTTLHTNDAAGAIPRLIDMKVSAQLIPPALNLVIAQRLVRKVCQNCAEKYKPDEKTLNLLKKELKTLPDNIKKKYSKLDKSLSILKPGKGCKKCNNGYKGRIAIMELFTIDDEMEKLINKSPSIVEMKEMAIKRGMVTMKQDGILKVLKKTTTLEEVERVIGA